MKIAIPTGSNGEIRICKTADVNEGYIPVSFKANLEIDEEDIIIDDFLTYQSQIEGVAQDDLSKKYNSVSLRADWTTQIKSAVSRIVTNRLRYDSVEKKTGVPWWVVAILHMRESSFSMNAWLANGDPLSGPTVQVPAGLRCPGNPPWSWEDAAVVSLRHHNGTEKPELNTVGAALDYIERYNGLGYRTGAGRNTIPPSSSPYIWSGTTGYERGKYVADGRFSSTAIDAQIGAAAIMMELQALGIGLGFIDDPKRDAKPLVVTWLELYRLETGGCSVIGWAGDQAVFRQDTVAVTDLKKIFDKYTGANTFRVASPGKPLPGIGPGPAPTPQPNSNPLNVPYFYQYNNKFEPGATCGLTSAAMLINFLGGSVTPDSLYIQYGKPHGQSPDQLRNLYAKHGHKAFSQYRGTYQEMRNAIDHGSPVVLHGFFTASGHIICVVGYRPGEFIVNDPAGVWDGIPRTGYRDRPENGRQTVYSINQLVAACGRDGELWISYVLK